VAFEIRCQRSQLEKLALGKKTGFGPSRIEQGSGMAFRQNKPIAIGSFRILEVISHDGEEKGRGDVRSRTTTRRMPAPRFARCANALDPEPRGLVLQFNKQFGRGD